MAEKRRKGTAQRVREIAEPIASSLGLSVWDVTFTKEGADHYLTVYIDREGGVSIDNCVDMTHALDPELDRENPIDGPYMLSVSSPGADRKLTRPEHFRLTLEKPVRVRLIRPLETGERELEGILMDVAENGDFELLLSEEDSRVIAKKDCAFVQRIDYFEEIDDTDGAEDVPEDEPGEGPDEEGR